MTDSRPEQDARWLARLGREGAPALSPTEAPALSCRLAPSIALLRAGRYWDAHESLEDLWRATPYPLRLFPYALIKVAVGLLHCERGNAAAAGRQLTQAALYLQPFTPIYGGIDTADILRQVEARLAALAGGDGGHGAASGDAGTEPRHPFTFPAARGADGSR